MYKVVACDNPKHPLFRGTAKDCVAKVRDLQIFNPHTTYKVTPVYRQPACQSYDLREWVDRGGMRRFSKVLLQQAS